MKSGVIAAFLVFLTALALACPQNRVLSLDGEGDYVEIPPSPSLEPVSNLTVEEWCRAVPKDVSTHFAICGKVRREDAFPHPSYVLAINLTPTTDLVFAVQNNSGPVPPVIQSNAVCMSRWTHVAGTYDGKMIRLYVDGQFTGSDLVTGSISYTNLPLRIGMMETGSWFRGEIDEVRLWGYIRSQQDIRSAMFDPLSGTESNLLGYWGFDTGTANDQSPNGNNGTLRGDAHIVQMPSFRPSISNETIQAVTGIQCETLSNEVYRLEYTTDLLMTNWVPSRGYILGNGATMTLFDPLGFSTQKFYRVILDR